MEVARCGAQCPETRCFVFEGSLHIKPSEKHRWADDVDSPDLIPKTVAFMATDVNKAFFLVRDFP